MRVRSLSAALPARALAAAGGRKNQSVERKSGRAEGLKERRKCKMQNEKCKM
jgi:hypothetical protein